MKPRTCKGCGAEERVDAIGFTNIAPSLGFVALREIGCTRRDVPWL